MPQNVIHDLKIYPATVHYVELSRTISTDLLKIVEHQQHVPLARFYKRIDTNVTGQKAICQSFS